MSTQESQIDLEGPLNYFVFTETPVNLQWADHERFVAVELIECDKNGITLNILTSNSDVNTVLEPGMTGTVSASYQSRRLSFDIALTEYDAETGRLYCERPRTGVLVNSRNSLRSRFNVTGNALFGTFMAETLAGPATFTSHELCDFSAETLSLKIDRQQGLLLPSDMISGLSIYHNDKCIFETCGEVQRVEPGDEDDDTIYVVVRFTDPDAKPKYDIEPNKRRSERVTMTNRSDAFVEFTHPLIGETISAYVTDLSLSGLAVTLTHGKFAFPPGLLMPEASLQLPLRPRLRVPLRVKAVNTERENGQSVTRLSMEFAAISPKLTNEVLAFVYQAFSDNLTDSSIDDYQELWEFYFNTRFIYESKRRQLQEYSQTVLNTQKTLFQKDPAWLKKIIYKDHGEILGHGIAIKLYDNTMLLQHLNAKKANGGSIGRVIVRGLATMFLDKCANEQNDNRYACTYYRPNNLFPALVFGESSKLIDNPDISWQMDYEFCRMNGQLFDAITDPAILCREATEDDKAALERHLINSGELRLLRLERLARDTLTDMQTFEDYKAIGLYRYRRVFVAQHEHNGALCYAVCSYASPGLNLSELTNSVKFLFTTEDAGKRKALINRLTPIIIDSYSDTEMRDPVFLVRPGEPIPNGFVSEKIYTLWTMDMFYPKMFKRCIDMILNDFKGFIKRSRAS